ncbi:MAG: DUF3187 family protein [Pseudomonadota bacterium]
MNCDKVPEPPGKLWALHATGCHPFVINTCINLLESTLLYKGFATLPNLILSKVTRVNFMALRWLLTLLLVVPVSGIAQIHPDVPTGPLQVRNLSPIVQLYGLPRMTGARIVDRLHTTFNIEAANNFQSEARDNTFAFFDGETYVASYRVRGRMPDLLTERWAPAAAMEWGFEVPYVAHTGGGLDGLVDEFHELFGLPDGERSLARRGRLDYLVQSDGVVYADFDDSQRVLGDVRGFAAYQVFSKPRSAFIIRSQLKLPTGSVRRLSGSKGWDVSVWGEYERVFALEKRSLRLSLGAGFSYLGEGELIPDAQEHWVGIGHVGLQYALSNWVELHAQLDAHSEILDTGNPLVANGGVLGTLGGRVKVTPKMWVDLAIIEDLEAKSASDVVFQVLLGARF